MGTRGKKAGWKAVTLTPEAIEALGKIERLMGETLSGATVNLDGLLSGLLVREATRMEESAHTPHGQPPR